MMHSRPNVSSSAAGPASGRGDSRDAPASYGTSQSALVDEYELIRPLGSGTMGQVFLAQDLVLDRRVAVKFISQDSPSATLRERFLVEARAIARLQHPNVVSIYRVGVVGGRPYLASEFVRGKSLEKIPLPLPWRGALDIGTQLARGLAAAHRQGIIHREVMMIDSNCLRSRGKTTQRRRRTAKVAHCIPNSYIPISKLDR